MKRYILGACLACAVGSSPGCGGGDPAHGDGGACPAPQAVLFTESGRYTRELWVDHAAGSDDNDGSAGSPWASMRRAGVGRAPGDRVHVRAGTYFDCMNIDGLKGTAQSPVAFVAEGAVRVSGADGCEAISGSGVAYILVEGFDVFHTDADQNGIHFDGGSHHVVVRRNTVHGIGQGGDCLKINATDDVWVLSNDLHSADTSGGSSQAVDLVAVHRALVQGNHAHDIQDSQAMFAKGGSEDVVFERNLIERITTSDGHNSNSIGIVLGGQTDRGVFNPRTADYEARRLVARNNVILGADGGGVAADGCHDCLIAGNTLWNTGRYGYAVVLGVGATGDGASATVSHNVGVRVVDNLVLNPEGTMRAPIQAEAPERQGLTLARNLWWNGDRNDVFDPGYNTAVGVDEPRSMVNIDPRVVDPNLPDVHLLPSSPARGAGAALPELSDDYDGHCRGPRMDLGAYTAP